MKPTLYARLRSIGADRSGVAMLELALVSPILAMMALGTVDYALLITSKLAVEGAARDGAAYAVSHGYTSTAIANVITGNSRTAPFLTSITASPAPALWYGCANANTGVVSAAGSTTICTNGLTAGTYVTVAAQGTYTFLVPWPGLGTSHQITSNVSVRIS